MSTKQKANIPDSAVFSRLSSISALKTARSKARVWQRDILSWHLATIAALDPAALSLLAIAAVQIWEMAT